jgi:hypothetical protein
MRGGHGPFPQFGMPSLQGKRRRQDHLEQLAGPQVSTDVDRCVSFPYFVAVNPDRSEGMAAIIQRVFYRGARGPTPADEDVWRLVFDPSEMLLLVLHEWEAIGHNGVEEFEITEFLAQEGAAQTALIDVIFGRIHADAYGTLTGEAPPDEIGNSLRSSKHADPKS